MRINYILSATTNGATTKALREVIKQSENDIFGNYIIIVPEPKSIAIEREILDLSTNGAVSNVFIYSFVRLLDRIGEIDEHKILSKQTCVMLLRQIIMENAENLKCYHKACQTNGFAEKIYDTIQQFKSSGVDVNDLRNAINSCDESLRIKLYDILLIFEEYQRLLGDSMFDDCDKLNLLSQFSRTNEFIKDAHIFIVGFDNVTAEMISVLKDFAINAKSVTFSACYFNNDRKDKYIQNNELYRKYVSVAEKLKYPYVPIYSNPVLSGDFWNMQNYLFSTEQKQVASDGSVKLLEFSSKRQEIEFVAGQIIQEVKAGKRFRDLAVIDSEFDEDEVLLKEIFEDYNIPYFLKKSHNISNHFFIDFIKNSVDMIRFNLSKDTVLCWISNALISSYDYAVFENYVNEFGINYSAFLKHVTEQEIEDSEKRQKINEILDFIKNFYEVFRNEFSQERKVCDFIQSINRIANTFDVQEKLKNLSMFERDNNLIVEAEITEMIFEKFTQVNNNFVNFLGNLIVSPERFMQIYLTGFSEVEINIKPVSIDSVYIQKNIDGLYKIKSLFVIGAVEGKFPISLQDSGIILDKELLDAGVAINKEIEPTVKQINKRENYKIYEMLLLPTEKLFLSYSLKSLSGASNKPSRVFGRVKNLFKLDIVKDYYHEEIVSKKMAEKKFAKSVGEYLIRGEELKKEINLEYNRLRNGMSARLKGYFKNMQMSNQEFVISNARKIFFKDNKTSVSQLEQYFACPYAFFVKYGLRLKENKKASISSLDIGTIVHKFTELFVKNISLFDGLNEDEFDKESEKIFSRALDELTINRKKNVAVLKFISDETKRLAKYIFNEQKMSNFKNEPRLNEFRFKASNSVHFVVDAETIISLEGVIDRIDKFGDYIRIIDYKTGKIENNLNAIYYGKKLQLVSYLHAISKIGKQKIAGIFYFPIHSDFVKIEKKIKNNYKMSGFLLDDIDVVKNMDITLSYDNPESCFVPLKIKTSAEVKKIGKLEISHGASNNYLSEADFQSLKSYNERLCVQAIKEILSGYIEPSPLQKISDNAGRECLYCEFAGFCGRENARFGDGRKYGTNITLSNFEIIPQKNNSTAENSEVKNGN